MESTGEMSADLAVGDGPIPSDATLCCLACALKGIGVHERITQLVLYSMISWEDLEDVGVFAKKLQDRKADDWYGFSEEYFGELVRLSEDQAREIKAVVGSLKEHHSPQLVPVTHRLYYQNTAIKILSPIDQSDIANGDLERGEILEVFFDSTLNKRVINDFVRQILDRCMERHVRATAYDNLTGFTQDSCLTLSVDMGYIRHDFLGLHEATERKCCNYRLDWTSRRSKEYIQEQLDMFKEEKVSAIIIKDIELSSCADVRHSPKIADWLEVMSFSLGHLKYVALVILIDTNVYNRVGITNLKDIRKLANRGIPKDTRKMIKWMDMTNIQQAGQETTEPIQILPLSSMMMS